MATIMTSGAAVKLNSFVKITPCVAQASLRALKAYATVLAYIIALLGLTTPSATFAQFQFEDVAEERGIYFNQRSYGASWGDFQGDGWPDLWTSNHAKMAKLFISNGDGTFTESIKDVWPDRTAPDAHGAAWGDFDNDGDHDLLQLTGARSGTKSISSLFLVNQNGTLINEASSRGLAYPLGRGRTPTWLDWNNDGQLDVFQAVVAREEAPSELFIQGSGQFFEFGLPSHISSQTNLFAQLKDLTGDGLLNLIIHSSSYPDQILALNSDSPQDLTETLGIAPTTNVNDAIIEDLDGDLDNDIFLIRSRRFESETIQTNATTIKTYLHVSSDEKGIRFFGGGSLTVQLSPSWNIKPHMIYIGGSGRQPSSLQFTVSPSDTGIVNHQPGADTGLYIGYDSTTGQWQLLLSSSNYRDLDILVKSTTAVSNLEAIGFNPNLFQLQERLLVQTNNGFVDRTGAAGFGTPTGCQSGVAGDFDNDMDLDLYLVCRTQVNNVTNILYENLGNGTFQSVDGAGGAAGSNAGRGDSATVVDFDRDGFLDIFVTNGWGHYLFSSGPYQLFRNLGNDNHWIELDLQGVVSNRDAIGAKVFLTAGGKTQLREQSGGMHNASQNHQRIHFGLGKNTVVDQVVIHWPSGKTQILNNLAADEIHTITEQTMVQVDPDGTPDYDPNVDKALLLWRGSDQVWRLRATAGGGRAHYAGVLKSSQAFTAVNPYFLENSDTLDMSEPSAVRFGMSMANGWIDGMDFSFTSGADTCLDVSIPQNATVLIGAARTPVSPPFNLTDFGPCEPVIDPDGAPDYDSNADEAVFLWRNPDNTWRLLGAAGGGWAHYRGTLSADQPFTSVTPFYLETSDTLDTSDPAVARFELDMINGWVDGIDFALPSGANVCLDVSAPWDVTILVGANRTPVKPPFSLSDFSLCN